MQIIDLASMHVFHSPWFPQTLVIFIYNLFRLVLCLKNQFKKYSTKTCLNATWALRFEIINNSRQYQLTEKLYSWLFVYLGNSWYSLITILCKSYWLDYYVFPSKLWITDLKMYDFKKLFANLLLIHERSCLSSDGKNVTCMSFKNRFRITPHESSYYI